MSATSIFSLRFNDPTHATRPLTRLPPLSHVTDDVNDQCDLFRRSPTRRYLQLLGATNKLFVQISNRASPANIHICSVEVWFSAEGKLYSCHMNFSKSTKCTYTNKYTRWKEPPAGCGTSLLSALRGVPALRRSILIFIYVATIHSRVGWSIIHSYSTLWETIKVCAKLDS